MSASNERIKKYEKELVAIRNTIPYDEMTEEEFAYAHPDLQIDFLNKPTMFPHSPEVQITQEDLDLYRKCNLMHPGPDKYFK